MDFFTASSLSKDDDDDDDDDGQSLEHESLEHESLEHKSLERNIASLIALNKSRQWSRSIRENLKNLETLLDACETKYKTFFGRAQIQITIGLLQKHYPPVFVYKTCRFLSCTLNAQNMQGILKECKQKMKSSESESSLKTVSAKLDDLVKNVNKALRLFEEMGNLKK